MSEFTKIVNIMQYTEVVYYRDGKEIGRERMRDDTYYDIEAPEPMTPEEIWDWA